MKFILIIDTAKHDDDPNARDRFVAKTLRLAARQVSHSDVEEIYVNVRDADDRPVYDADGFPAAHMKYAPDTTIVLDA